MFSAAFVVGTDRYNLGVFVHPTRWRCFKQHENGLFYVQFGPLAFSFEDKYAADAAKVAAVLEYLAEQNREKQLAARVVPGSAMPS